jgi:hypothetical protein
LSVDDESKLGPTADVEDIDENLVAHGTPCIRYRIEPLCAAAIISGLRDLPADSTSFQQRLHVQLHHHRFDQHPVAVPRDISRQSTNLDWCLR